MAAGTAAAVDIAAAVADTAVVAADTAAAAAGTAAGAVGTAVAAVGTAAAALDMAAGEAGILAVAAAGTPVVAGPRPWLDRKPGRSSSRLVPGLRILGKTPFYYSSFDLVLSLTRQAFRGLCFATGQSDRHFEIIDDTPLEYQCNLNIVWLLCHSIFNICLF